MQISMRCTSVTEFPPDVAKLNVNFVAQDGGGNATLTLPNDTVKFQPGKVYNVTVDETPLPNTKK